MFFDAMKTFYPSKAKSKKNYGKYRETMLLFSFDDIVKIFFYSGLNEGALFGCFKKESHLKKIGKKEKNCLLYFLDFLLCFFFYMFFQHV